MVDAIVLVVKAEQTKVTDVKEALDRLRKAGGNVIGVVLTNVRPERSRARYYDYGYSEVRQLDSSPSDRKRVRVKDIDVIDVDEVDEVDEVDDFDEVDEFDEVFDAKMM